MFCKNCSHEIDKNATFCPFCGTPVSDKSGNAMQDTEVKSYRKKENLNQHFHIIVGIVAIVLGPFGVHKYLMGRRWIWLIYAIFSWTFVPAIVGIIEGILYLSCSEEKFEQKYLFRKKEKE